MNRSLFFILALLLQGCASIVSNSAYPVRFDSNVESAEFVIRNVNGIEIKRGHTPATVILESGAGFFRRGVYNVEFSAPGYQTQTYRMASRMNEWYWGNLLNPIGLLLVDPATGAMWRLPLRLTSYLPEETNFTVPLE